MDILLSTLNARYSHSSFGLRYLFANLSDENRSRAEIVEFTIQNDPRKMAEVLLSKNPKIIGFGIYIWNTKETEALISILKKLKPEIIIVLGGPEVSYETQHQSIVQKANIVICGEGDFLFNSVCDQILNKNQFPSEKIIKSVLPEIDQIKSPYSYYTDHDIKNRAIYVEASRGCPYKCEYCLSSLDVSVRNFPLEPFLMDLKNLIDRGARNFKFIDRTFNLKPTLSIKILEFFLSQMEKELFLHFEMVPDRLPDELKTILLKFPPGSIQFEIGIQTFNKETAAHVSRKNDLIKVEENFKFLREKTHIHTHADLIAGLPGESLESFAAGFDRLIQLDPDEIQLGLLKRLKGTPIARHEQVFKMIYEDRPPFQILSTSTMPFSVIQDLERFADFWDLIGNSGNFKETLSFLKEESNGSFFWYFWKIVKKLSEKHLQTHSIALPNLTQSLWFVTLEFISDENRKLVFKKKMIEDYCIRGKRSLLSFMEEENSLKEYYSEKKKIYSQELKSTPQRQARHLA